MEKQRSWLRRLSQPHLSKHVSGTILHAVPQAGAFKPLTPLEEAMAFSPNQEILSAISREGFPVDGKGLSVESSLWNRSPISPIGRTEKRKEVETRVGVWRDGVVHWDEEVALPVGADTRTVEEVMVRTETGLTAVAGQYVDLGNRSPRPHLSVVIPSQLESSRVQPAFLHRMYSQGNLKAPHVPPRLSSRRNLATHESDDGVISPIELDRCDASIDKKVMDTEPAEHIENVAAVAQDNSLLLPGPSRSSSSSGTVPTLEDDASIYSQQSSCTSVEPSSDVQSKSESVEDGSEWSGLNVPKRSASAAFSILSPTKAGVFDDVSPARDEVAVPTVTQRKVAKETTLRAASLRVSTGSKRPSSRGSHGSLDGLNVREEQFLKTDQNNLDVPEPASPTLSQAEKDLQAHLNTIDEAQPLHQSSADFQFNLSQVPARVPTLPKKSRKRQWRASAAAAYIATPIVLELPEKNEAETELRRWNSVNGPHASTLLLSDRAGGLPRRAHSTSKISHTSSFAKTIERSSEATASHEVPIITVDDSAVAVDTLRLHALEGKSAQEAPVIRPSTPAEATAVLLRIMSSLDDLDDLFAASMINKGMYQVYKENELQLLQTVHRKMSPAASEFRQWCPISISSRASIRSRSTDDEADELLTHTPQTFMQAHIRDTAVITSLKTLILDRCQTYLRPSTVAAFTETKTPQSRRLDSAFYRIWCFSTIFGSSKGREDDITGQLDWLKGGLLAHQNECGATVSTSLEFDMSSVLLSAPEWFAAGNRSRWGIGDESGLTLEELYDMTELWHCLVALLQGYQGRTDQARANGVFDNVVFSSSSTRDAGKRQEEEDQALEEWLAYILTLGLPTVLQLAHLSPDLSDAGFALASARGWTTWSPLPTSRTTFLKEPVARLYETRYAAAALAAQDPRLLQKREMSRRRVANLAAEIKLARCGSAYARLPLIAMGDERPMSMLSRTGSRSTVSSFAPASDSAASTGGAVIARGHVQQEDHLPRPHPFAHIPYPDAAAAAMVAAPLPMPLSQRPPTPYRSPRKVSPIIEDRVTTFNRLSDPNLLERYRAHQASAPNTSVPTAFNDHIHPALRTREAVASLGGEAMDTAERAVRRITEMGWSERQAREALRVTDMGDGLRVDRAVEVLLRR